MWNPFKAKLTSAYQYSPLASAIENDTDSHPLHNSVNLDDAIFPDTTANQYRGNVGNIDQGQRPGYAGDDRRELVYSPDALPGYNFLSPAPGSTDLIAPRDSNSVPGTTSLNVMHGPVTGSAMDEYQTGNRQILMTAPPGSHGPVVGGPDYSTTVAYATFQEAFSSYSNAATDNAIVSAI